MFGDAFDRIACDVFNSNAVFVTSVFIDVVHPCGGQLDEFELWELRDNFGYDPGGACDIIMVRGFYKWEPITPGLGYFMEQLPGDYILEARAVVRNEPFTTSLAGC